MFVLDFMMPGVFASCWIWSKPGQSWARLLCTVWMLTMVRSCQLHRFKLAVSQLCCFQLADFHCFACSLFTCLVCSSLRPSHRYHLARQLKKGFSHIPCVLQFSLVNLFWRFSCSRFIVECNLPSSPVTLSQCTRHQLLVTSSQSVIKVIIHWRNLVKIWCIRITRSKATVNKQLEAE